MNGSINSRTTRVQPVFEWLWDNGEDGWPERLVKMAGVVEFDRCGSRLSMDLRKERKVPATHDRLRWMIEHAGDLAPKDGRRWNELRQRVEDRDEVERALASLADKKSIPRRLVLEGKTHADCLIECEHAFIWIEGKRLDWLSPSTTWDVARDQLARNTEAVWSLAEASEKDYRMLICHEHPLKHHEVSLLEGYRAGTWSAGWPHICPSQRRELSKRIGTVKWTEIAGEWPALRELEGLRDIPHRPARPAKSLEHQPGLIQHPEHPGQP
jgi:hypothetical protein